MNQGHFTAPPRGAVTVRTAEPIEGAGGLWTALTLKAGGRYFGATVELRPGARVVAFDVPYTGPWIASEAAERITKIAAGL